MLFLKTWERFHFSLSELNPQTSLKMMRGANWFLMFTSASISWRRLIFKNAIEKLCMFQWYFHKGQVIFHLVKSRFRVRPFQTMFEISNSLYFLGFWGPYEAFGCQSFWWYCKTHRILSTPIFTLYSTNRK